MMQELCVMETVTNVKGLILNQCLLQKATVGALEEDWLNTSMCWANATST